MIHEANQDAPARRWRSIAPWCWSAHLNDRELVAIHTISNARTQVRAAAPPRQRLAHQLQRLPSSTAPAAAPRALPGDIEPLELRGRRVAGGDRGPCHHRRRSGQSKAIACRTPGMRRVRTRPCRPQSTARPWPGPTYRELRTLQALRCRGARPRRTARARNGRSSLRDHGCRTGLRFSSRLRSRGCRHTRRHAGYVSPRLFTSSASRTRGSPWSAPRSRPTVWSPRHSGCVAARRLCS